MAETTYFLCKTYLKRVDTPKTHKGKAKILFGIGIITAIVAFIIPNTWLLLVILPSFLGSAGLFLHEDYVKQYNTKETIYSVPTVFEYYQKNPIYAKAYDEMKNNIESDSFSEKYWQGVFNTMNKEIIAFDDKIKQKKIDEAIPSVDYAAEIKKSHELYLGKLDG